MLSKEIDKKILHYFNKKLMLSDTVSKLDMITHSDTDADDDAHLYEEENIPMVSSDSEADVANAYKMLGFFPLDKTQFVTPEMRTKERNLFGDISDVDQTVNALLFSTRLLFLDSTPIKTKQLLSVVAQDSYGYMNIIRSSQVSLLDEEIASINEVYNKTENSFIKSTIKMFNKNRMEQRNSDEDYLNEMISFYAEHVLNPDFSIEERRSIVKEWLGEKLKQEFS